MSNGADNVGTVKDHHDKRVAVPSESSAHESGEEESEWSFASKGSVF